jgi:uncharacterized protein YecT (DUF1311 family)
MNAAAATRDRDADAQLNSLYAQIEARLAGDDRERLAAAERSWLGYRDANCAAETGLYSGGSIAPQIESACLAKLTEERTAELRRIYGDQLNLP